jgi:hypothetical protein
MKLLTACGVMLLMATGVSAQGNIELSWSNIVAKKPTEPIAAVFTEDNGIVINGVPNDRAIGGLRLTIGDQTFAAPDSSDQDPAVAGREAIFSNMGKFLTQHLSKNKSAEVVLFDGQNIIGSTIVPAKQNGVAVAGSPVNNSKLYENAIELEFGLAFKTRKIKIDRRLNQAREKNIIHLFMDEIGNFYYSNLPTTAREDNIYIFHLFYREGDGTRRFKLEYDGVFDPQFEVFGAEGAAKEVAAQNATGQTVKEKITHLQLGPIGPFTGSFTVRIFEVGNATPILNRTVNVAKLHHITLSAGLYGTWLRNPENTSILARPETGDSTLVADDPTNRGFVTVMLTWYFKPRNILFPSSDWRERIGFSVGTSISKKLAENFFGGLSYDLARGLSITGGVHYGRQNYVIDYPEFEFGKDKFSGSLDNRIRKRWAANAYVGLNMDFRLLTYIFNPSAGAQQQ